MSTSVIIPGATQASKPTTVPAAAAAHQPDYGKPVHPVSDLFPLIEGDEFADLCADINAHGLVNPIVIHEGCIVDGRNRLLACQEVDVEPRFVEWRDVYTGSMSLVRWIWSTNIERRHLTVDQLLGLKASVIGWEEKEAARQRQKAGGGDKKSANSKSLMTNSSEAMATPKEPLPSAGTVRAHLAKETGASEHKAQQVLNVQKLAPNLLPQVIRGSMTLLEADKQVKAETATDVPEDVSDTKNVIITLPQWKLMSIAEREAALRGSGEARKPRLNKQKGDSIEWARWSWNPVTGCLHNCPYCYARDLAERFYPQKFEPSIVPDRLTDPIKMAVPEKAQHDLSYKNIFTCSMADLFGKWVPDEWIEAVLTVARAAPEWNFLMLTKFPQRLHKFEFPDNCWLGTSVDMQARVANAERAMREVNAKTKWLSIEPLIEPLDIDFSIFQWIAIGGASRSSQTPEWKPPRRWVRDMWTAAEKAGCAVYLKSNLNDERWRDFPWHHTQDVERAPKEFHYLKNVQRAGDRADDFIQINAIDVPCEVPAGYDAPEVREGQPEC